ncbi:MAG: hypothetical protein ABID38_01780 [Candidatus Diapherotrites archaeon]
MFRNKIVEIGSKMRRRRGDKRSAAGKIRAGELDIKEMTGRNVIPSRKAREELMVHLEEKLKYENFFESLPLTTSLNVKKFEFNGIPIAIKNTENKNYQGANHREFKAAFIEYRRALKEGTLSAKHHILLSPVVYGKIGPYLIMEYVEDKYPLSSPELSKYWKADGEITSNFMKLLSDKKINAAPQMLHLMTLKNTNPKNPRKGKWVGFHPYDYE